MTDEVNKLRDYWIKFLKTNNKGEILNIQTHYPKDKTLTIDVSKIFDNKIWKNVFDVPGAAIEEIEEAAREIFDLELKVHPVIRFINITKKTLIKDLNPDADEDKLRSISCLVKRSSIIQSKILVATYKCTSHHTTKVKSNHETLPKPKVCSYAGCLKRDFTHIDKMDVKINRQFIYVQELLDNIGADHQPKSIRCEVFGDLCNIAVTGDRMVLNGYYRTAPKNKDGVLQAGRDVYFEVNSMERNENEFGDIKWTSAEEQQMQNLFKKPEIYDLLVDSIAPSIMGMRLCKQAIVMMLFGGVTKTMSDGTRRRGHLNILIVSDPGMAKTVILKFVEQVSPRGVYASGATSSKVGLVAPLVRDETSGSYTIEPGPYMLANGGVFCLDEANEIPKDDAKYIGECMENGQCTITKALNAVVKTEAPLLAACNPNDGTYNTSISLEKQVSLPPAILSRFDLKIILTDDIVKDRDRELAKHIGKTMRSSYVPEHDVISPDLLRKMIAYARRCIPEFTDGVDTLISNYYEKIRIESKIKDNMSVTPRQLVSIYHLSEAQARIHGRNTVLIEDAQKAIDLFDLAFHNLTVDAKPRDSKPKKNQIGRVIVDTILEIGGGTKKCSEMSLVSAMKKKNAEEGQIMDALRILKQEGTLLEPTTGLLQVI